MTKRMAREPKTVLEQPSTDASPVEPGSEPVTGALSAPASAQAPEPKRTTKIAVVIALLSREEGATLGELVEATGWLPHTTRAALTGLKKKGYVLDKSKRGEVTCYRIAGAR
jgi:hypothetical protein